MIQACLATGTSYADIGNEIPQFQRIEQYDRVARQQGIALVPGVGFGVVVTNCLARFVAEQLPDATELRMAHHIAAANDSVGAAETGLDIIRGGGYVIRRGVYQRYRLGRGATEIPYADAKRFASPAPLGDLAAAFMATEIPNITMSSTALPTGLAGLALPLIRRLLAIPAFRQQLLRTTQAKPADEKAPPHSQAWAWGRNAAGKESEAWLSTGDGYEFTAAASVLAMERLLNTRPVGVLAPAVAFGTDFVLDIPHTQRFTSLAEIKQPSA